MSFNQLLRVFFRPDIDVKKLLFEVPNGNHFAWKEDRQCVCEKLKGYESGAEW